MRNEFWRLNIGHILIVVSMLLGMALSHGRLEGKFEQVEKRVARIEMMIDGWLNKVK